MCVQSISVYQIDRFYQSVYTVSSHASQTGGCFIECMASSQLTAPIHTAVTQEKVDITMSSDIVMRATDKVPQNYY